MKFAWTEKDKERFFKRAERQLKAAGIDFVQVDREQIGVKEWNAEKQTADGKVVDKNSLVVLEKIQSV